MKTPFLVLLLVLIATAAAAQSTFPGLKAILSDTEWKRAGLDRLSPDQIGVIDAALIRQQAGVVARQPAAPAATTPATPATTVAAAAIPMQRFGLPDYYDGDWRAVPPLRAKVLKWEGGNRFRLDNGQLWEGYDPITYELVGKDIEIQARPHDQFALVVDGLNTTIRVMRLR